eukprot:1313654-Rhodomonas_salina.1
MAGRGRDALGSLMTVRAWAGLNVTAKWLPTQIGNAYHDLFQTSSKLRSNVVSNSKWATLFTFIPL